MAEKKNLYLSIRLDPELKAKFELFCSHCGTTLSGAVNLMAAEVIKGKALPFVPTAAEGYFTGNNPVFGTGTGERASIRFDQDKREAFKEACAKLGVGGLSMSEVVKMFMLYCVNTGKMPF